MRLTDLKSNDKLPRGTYFYIQVGQRFYAGQQIEQIEVESDPSDERPLTHFEKDGRYTEVYRRRLQNQYWWTIRSRGPKGNRRKRDVSKGTLPKYAQTRKRPEKVIRKEFTGRSLPRLVDELNQAKQFRSKDSVQSACDMLTTMYGKTGAKISVRYYGGTQ